MNMILKGKIMTNKEILRIAMEQSAIDLSAEASDFEKSENGLVLMTATSLSVLRLALPIVKLCGR